MRRRILIGVVVVSLLTAGVAGVGVATAQTDDPNGGSDDDAADDETTNVVTEVDRQVRVTNYSYDREQEIMTVELDHHDPGGSTAQLTLTELIDSSSGGGTFGVEQLQLSPGETITVDVNVRVRGGQAGVMITSQESLQEGEGAFVIHDESLDLISGPATWGDVRAGSIAGILVTILITLLVSWRHVSKRDESYQEVSL